MTVTSPTEARSLLEAAYEGLGLDEGMLMPTADGPGADVAASEWINKGEWLLLGHRMGAEKIFFVDNDPVVLFTALPPASTESDVVAAYKKAWSLGRARCLFLATEGQLRVYALNEPPPRTLEEAGSLQPVDYANRVADVVERLADYQREKIESGVVFEGDSFRRFGGRADVRLLEDVAAATDALVDTGLPRPIAHFLIERVILVRYLEDRGVIGPEYFSEVAARNPAWFPMLTAAEERVLLGPDSTFVSCLSDRDLTYAVFDKLSKTFNGDMFVVADDEAQSVSIDHLRLVQQLLTGAGFDVSYPLFLWAYDFSVVPTSLIGSMYEQFYHADSDDTSSTHYTPQELVEHVISEVLTPEVLKENPRVCDPACGSGVFLVEAFRRIARYEMAVRSSRLTSSALKDLLLTRIAGIDTNREAIRLAAFSLYLAFLNYQEPPDITSAGPLPYLIHRSGRDPADSVLVQADAFAPFEAEALIESSREDSSSVSSVQGGTLATLPWEANSFDVVIGNPPWDEPRAMPRTTAETWALENGMPVGDRSPSQLFLWRALTLLKPNGVAALLVAATAFHNARSRAFRKHWLRKSRVISITDFTSVRRFFFNASAPFALAVFGVRSPGGVSGRLLYRSIRPSESLRIARSMSYARSDMRWVAQDALYERDYLWKTYAWGGHRDAALMARLDLETQLSEVIPGNPDPGWGYQYGDARNGKPASNYLASIRSLNRLEFAGPLRSDHFEDAPIFVKRSPDERRYSGQRILVSEGVRPGFGPVSRLVYEELSFRHKIYCIPIPIMPSWQAKVMLGILISSLGRYRIFMRSGSWGLWRDKVNAEDILATPIRFPVKDGKLAERIGALVEQLTLDIPGREFREGSLNRRGSVVREGYHVSTVLGDIDECVYDLFELSQAERDLVDDFHSYTVDISGSWRNAPGLREIKVRNLGPGTARDIERVNLQPMQDYLDRFLDEWNSALGPEGELSWSVVTTPSSELIAAVFETQNRDETEEPLRSLAEDWAAVLERLQESAPAGRTRGAAGDRIIRSVSDTSIIIIKRREARLWSATAGREDAEATMLQAMTLQDA